MLLRSVVLLLSALATSPSVWAVNKTPISGVNPPGGVISNPGTQWMDGNVLHIRGQVISDAPTTGDLLGVQTIIFNMDLNTATGVGVVHNTVTVNAQWVGRGLTGSFKGHYAGIIRGGTVVQSRAVFKGSGEFAGMVFVGQANGTPPGPFFYSGVIIEP